MISKTINLSTGPVAITREVQAAVSAFAVSHRSVEFKNIFNNTRARLSEALNVKETFILSGSGSLANEAMLQQLRFLPGKGLILSNGEFGSRLIAQARRIQLDFDKYEKAWGAVFCKEEVRAVLDKNFFTWLLFCHCETSTGVLNDLDGLAALAKKKNLYCFVDCMSTVGTRQLDLSQVSMATASSGKGLASLPGLALIFSNMELLGEGDMPSYLDLGLYARREGIPFTISSNLVKALSVSIKQKLVHEQFDLSAFFRQMLFKLFNAKGLLPFNNSDSSVINIGGNSKVYKRLVQQESIVFSYESDYLKKRCWSQLASFGFYTEEECKFTLNYLQERVAVCGIRPSLCLIK